MKIVVVGAGNAGCFTALHYYWFTRNSGIELELIHNPSINSEPVGQATTIEAPGLLQDTLGFNWNNNSIYATPKSGILYEGWGKVREKFFHPFVPNRMAMHFCPSEMQKSTLKSGLFKVTEGDVDPKDVDADYVFDCRGKPKDFSDYNELKNPINSVILGRPNWDVNSLWTRAVATPDGWTFVLPGHKDSPSYDGCVGYLYNNKITSKEEAEKNFLDLFDVDISGYLTFNNYVAKNPIVDDRIILNGNRLFFLEPLEATGIQGYLHAARFTYNAIIEKSLSLKQASKTIVDNIIETQNFILWHYQHGSKYDTPFWNYAKGFTFKDPQFNMMIKRATGGHPVWGQEDLPENKIIYGQHTMGSIKSWYEGVVV